MWFLFFWSLDSSLGFSRGVEAWAAWLVKLNVFLLRASLDKDASGCREPKLRPRPEAVTVLELDGEPDVEGEDRRRRFCNEEVEATESDCREM